MYSEIICANILWIYKDSKICFALWPQAQRSNVKWNFKELYYV